MVRPDRFDESKNDDFTEGAFDAGLRAAFGGSSDWTTDAGRVVSTLQQTMGIRPSVMLRDDPNLSDAMIKPLTPSERTSTRYQIVGEIARGGVGIVMKGRDPELGRDVALKTVRDEHLDKPAVVQRFVEEAQIAGQLQHPGILPVYELGMMKDGKPFFTMKLVKGQTLAELLVKRQSPSDDRQRFVTIFRQMCEAVAYAHTKGVIHRDLKPSNIMVGAFGEVQVVDWGLAKVLAHGGATDDNRRQSPNDDTFVETVRTLEPSTHSVVGSVMGTPPYMCPEQARGDVDSLDQRSDVFSLGAILCEILTGRPPYTAEGRDALQQAADADLSDAHNRLDTCDADADLINIVRQCLSPVPSDRPLDAGVVAESVESYQASLEQRARESELTAARAEARAKHERHARNLTLALGVAGLIVVAVIVIAVLFFQAGERERAATERRQIAEKTQIVNGMIDRASQLLGSAIAAPVGEDEPWQLAIAAAEPLNDYIETDYLDMDTRNRATSLLDRLSDADRDRLVVNTIEEVVIMGATHNDKVSWLWMEKELRRAFRDYGIDIDELSPTQVAERIRESDLAPQLADGLELWVGTCGHLMTFGVMIHPVDKLKEWVAALSVADPDPVATAVRNLVYADQLTREEVEELVASIDFSNVRPRTLSWLSSPAFRVGANDLIKDIFRRALVIYPDDFMLNFDYSFTMVMLGQREKAIRIYQRCLAIRPDSPGIWRCVGVAYRELDELQASLDALNRAVQLQPDHAHTYLDLGKTHEKLKDEESAINSYTKAIELLPDLTQARERLDALKGVATDE